MKQTLICFVGLVLAAGLPLPAAAEMGLFGWGPRIGAADDPDQVVAGAHLDLGEFVPKVRFQPSFDAGFGDDYTTLSLTLPVHYRFKTEAAVQPYAGGGIRAVWIDRDKPRRNDSDFDLSPVLVGGAEWPLGKTSDVFLELQLGTGDAHDTKLFVGWTFRAR